MTEAIKFASQNIGRGRPSKFVLTPLSAHFAGAAQRSSKLKKRFLPAQHGVSSKLKKRFLSSVNLATVAIGSRRAC